MGFASLLFVISLVSFCNGATTVIPDVLELESAENTTPDLEIKTLSGVDGSKDVKERVDVLFDASKFEIIDHDILRVIGDASNLTVVCQSNKDVNLTGTGKWIYHGLQKQDVVQYDAYKDPYINLTSGPPVARLECILVRDGGLKLRNSTYIYTGDDKPPYLHNSGNSVKATVLNETTATIPCVLNYPLDNKEPVELRLYKDGEEVENDCLSYTHELGYFLNLTRLESTHSTPLGKYECKIENSSDNTDVVTVDLKKENFVVVKYLGHLQPPYAPIVYQSAPNKQTYECFAPAAMYQNKFEWHYLLNDSSYLRIPSENITEATSSRPRYPKYFYETVKIAFPRTDIVGVVCVGFAANSAEVYNSSVAVQVKEAVKPDILNNPFQKPIIYQEGSNLTCASYGDPIDWKWLKDGKTFIPGNQVDVYTTSPTRRSTISLNQDALEPESKYTCVASNFLGEANHSFLVQLPPPPPPSAWVDWRIILAVSAGMVALFAAIMLAFFKMKFTPRLNRQHVTNFFNGMSTKEPQYNELEPYLRLAYDRTREISNRDLSFVRELKIGEFGEVAFGWLLNRNNNTETPVAIKRMRRNSARSERDSEFAFLDFLNEIKLMGYIGFHRNLVSYIGAVTSDLERFSAFLVVEYCNVGDLQSYLQRMRDSFQDDIQNLHQNIQQRGMVLKTSDLMRLTEDIAAGVAYIHSKGILHRDLAARNVLLQCQGMIAGQEELNPNPAALIAKISDLGLARDLNNLNSDYYQIVVHPDNEQNRPRWLPYRWLSVEALRDLKFTPASDVWSMGVVFWEMFTLGQTPFNDFTKNRLIEHLEAENTLPEAPYACQQMWTCMTRCWSINTLERPTAGNMVQYLRELNASLQQQLQQQMHAALAQSAGNEPQLMGGYAQLGFAESDDTIDLGEEEEEEMSEHEDLEEEEANSNGDNESYNSNE